VIKTPLDRASSKLESLRLEIGVRKEYLEAALRCSDTAHVAKRKLCQHSAY
jgi:hypothetical protein